MIQIQCTVIYFVVFHFLHMTLIVKFDKTIGQERELDSVHRMNQKVLWIDQA